MKISKKILMITLIMFILPACTPILSELVPAPENGGVSEDAQNISSTQSPNISGDIIVFTPTNGPNQVSLKLGDILIVQIPTIKEEAFAWVLTDLDTNILIQDGEPAYKEDPNMDLGGGVFEFKLQSIGVGETNLSFEYESDAASLGKDTFGMTVTVSDGKGKIVVVTPSPRGNSATLSVGDTLVLEIPTIPEEEFHWVVKNLDRDILIEQSEPIYIADNDPDSAGGVSQFKFTAVSSGQTNVSLIYVTKDGTVSKDSFGMSVNVIGGEGETVVVTPSPRGNSATLNVGDLMVLEIPTIPEEGFEWMVEDIDTSILVQVGEPEYIADTDPNSAGGVVRFTFTAVGPGETSLSLMYVQINDAEPTVGKDSFGMTVIVK